MSVAGELFLEFALLSLVAFGGATALLPEMHRVVVENHHWLDDTTFTHLYAIAQAAPGPNVLVVTLILLILSAAVISAAPQIRPDAFTPFLPHGWLPVGDDAYLHVGNPDALVIDVVGVADAGMAGVNVLWVG